MSTRKSDNGNTSSDRNLATVPESRPRRWDPFTMINELEREMDRMFGSRFPSVQPFLRGVSRAGRSGHAWSPSADVYEKDGNLVVTAELPGVDRDDISVAVENGDLVIQGERRSDEEVDEDNYYRMERFSGSFYRRFALPEGVNEDDISAEYRDGVLQVRIPKPSDDEETPPRKTIPIA